MLSDMVAIGPFSETLAVCLTLGIIISSTAVKTKGGRVGGGGAYKFGIWRAPAAPEGFTLGTRKYSKS